MDKYSDVRLDRAQAGDLEHVKTMYRAVMGQQGCTWDESYPTDEDVQCDFAAGCLYTLLREGMVIGAVSIVLENELDDIPSWKLHDGTQRELARVVISPQWQGKGYAREMVGLLLSRLRETGCHSARLLVALENEAAMRVYSTLGFERLGTCSRYGHDFYICEKVMD